MAAQIKFDREALVRIMQNTRDYEAAMAKGAEDDVQARIHNHAAAVLDKLLDRAAEKKVVIPQVAWK